MSSIVESDGCLLSASLSIARVDALALLGKKSAAITVLQKLVDDGYRVRWRWSTELNRNLASLQDEPAYIAIVDWLRFTVRGLTEFSPWLRLRPPQSVIDDGLNLGLEQRDRVNRQKWSTLSCFQARNLPIV